jgi:hypothetical protein
MLFGVERTRKLPARKRTAAGRPQSNQRLKLLEEFAALDEKVANFKPRILRHQKLRSLILSWYPTLPAEDEQRIPAKTCDIIITSKDLIRTVSPGGKQALFKLWGSRGFIANATVHLKSLPDPEDRKGLYTVQAPTGPRHLKVIDRNQAAIHAA